MRPNRWRYLVRGYYAADVAPPKVPGDLALEVGCANESARDLELAVFRRRPDIDQVEALGPLDVTR